MKNFHSLKHTGIVISCMFLAIIFFSPGCKTGELKEQVAMLSLKQVFLAAERDSLQRLLLIKTHEFDTIYVNYNTLSTDYKTVTAKNKSLQTGYYTRGEQLKKTALTNEELNNSLTVRNIKNDSLISKNDSQQKEIVTLQQRIAAIDAMIAENQKTNTALAKTIAEKENRITSDSTISSQLALKVLKESGFISITEIGGAFGLADISTDYSKSCFSLTTIAGYRVNSHFLTGIGAGVNVYNGGTLIPLYIDLRYALKDGKFTPFIVADGGVLLNPKDFITSSLFINPGLGIKSKLSDKASLHLSAGVLVHQSPGLYRTSFINIKAGVSFSGK